MTIARQKGFADIAIVLSKRTMPQDNKVSKINMNAIVAGYDTKAIVYFI